MPNPAETGGLADFHPVEMLQDQAQCILGDYVRSRHPRQPTRFGRLLLAIPLLIPWGNSPHKCMLWTI